MHDGPSGHEPVRWAVEATYEGSVRFDESILEDTTGLAPVVATLTQWISSTLVRLADLPLTFLPPDPADEGEQR